MIKEIFKCKISPKLFILPVVFASLFLIETIVFFITIGINGAFIPFVISVLIILPAFIKYSCTNLILYDSKIKGEIGFFKKQTLDAPLDKINDIYVSQGIIGRLFGYGKINISTSSSVFNFKGIENCEQFKNCVLEQIEVYKKEQIEIQAKMMSEALKNVNK